MLTRAMLWSGRRDLVATFLALAIGAAISVAVLSVHRQATPGVPTEYAAADVLIQPPTAGDDDDHFTEYVPWSADGADELARTLDAQQGVAAAVPARAFYAQLVVDGRPEGNPDPDLPEGRTWSMASLAPYPLTAGRAPRGGDEVAVSGDYGLRPGDRVTLLTGPGSRPVTVSGTVAGPGIYLSDDAGRRLAAGSTLIAVVTERGTDSGRLAADLRPLLPAAVTVLAGAEREAAEPESTARTRYLGTQLLTVMLLLTCFAAVLVTSQTFALAVSHRRLDVALLRALGATPAQVRRMTLLSAAAVGVVASAIGGVLGALLAPQLGAALVRAGLEPTGFVVQPDLAVALLVTLLGPLIAVAATWGNSRRVGQVAPVEAVRAAAVDVRHLGRWRLAAGVLAVVAATAAGAGAATSRPSQTALFATLATLFVIAAMTWLAPVLLPPVVRLLTWPLDRTRYAVGPLVRGAMTTAAARTAATAAPVLATVAFATLVVGYVETGRAVFGAADLPAGTTAVVAPQGTPGLTEDTVTQARRVAALNGESDVAASLLTRTFTGRQGQLTETLTSGEDDQPPGTASATRQLAERNGWQVGDKVTIVMADGNRLALRLTDVAPGGSVDVASLVLSRADVRRHDPSTLTSMLLLREVPPDRFADVVGPGVVSVTPATYASTATDAEYRLLQIFVLVILLLSAGYTGLAIGNTILMATGARRGDLTLLRLSGATPGQVLSATAGEATVTVAIGSVLGLLAGMAGLLGVRSGLAEDLGRTVDVVVPWGILSGLAGVCLLIAVAASAWPAWRIVRGAPVPAAVT